MLVDSNSVTDPLAELAEREGIEITHLLLTHHHYDHVVGAGRSPIASASRSAPTSSPPS